MEELLSLQNMPNDLLVSLVSKDSLASGLWELKDISGAQTKCFSLESRGALYIYNLLAISRVQGRS